MRLRQVEGREDREVRAWKKERCLMRKWHRWIGVGAALFLLSVATTGIILQFQQFFGDDEAAREKLAVLRSAYSLDSSLSDFGLKLDQAKSSLRRQVGNAVLDNVEIALKGEHPTFVFHLAGAEPQKVVVSADSEYAQETENHSIELIRPREYPWD